MPRRGRDRRSPRTSRAERPSFEQDSSYSYARWGEGQPHASPYNRPFWRQPRDPDEHDPRVLDSEPREGDQAPVDHSGRGPLGYRRPDDRIEDDVNWRLTVDPRIDATAVEVGVRDGEVTLAGRVGGSPEKRVAQEAAEGVFGVRAVVNRIQIDAAGET
jgi:hypothetical protein